MGFQDDLIVRYVVLIFSTERNVIEAAAKGASTAIALVANIAVNLIAFLAFLAFFNGVLSWVGSMVGHSELSFEVLVRKLCFFLYFEHTHKVTDECACTFCEKLYVHGL